MVNECLTSADAGNAGTWGFAFCLEDLCGFTFFSPHPVNFFLGFFCRKFECYLKLYAFFIIRTGKNDFVHLYYKCFPLEQNLKNNWFARCTVDIKILQVRFDIQQVHECSRPS